MVAIGGVGGSGTRVIAQILEKTGCFIGNDLNESNDTLLFTLLFKRQNILTLSEDEFQTTLNLFVKLSSSSEYLHEDELSFLYDLASKDRTLHSKEWLEERLKYVKDRVSHIKWGWKEPNTHIIAEKLLQKMPDLKFIYVYRNGLDMAYSENQNQLKLWGAIFLNDYELEINSKNSLKYWCITHKRMLKLQKKFQDKVFMLNFDELCLRPSKILKNFCNFIEYKGDKSQFIKLIKAPSSIGRYKKHSLKDFDKADLNFVSKIYKI